MRGGSEVFRDSIGYIITEGGFQEGEGGFDCLLLKRWVNRMAKRSACSFCFAMADTRCDLPAKKLAERVDIDVTSWFILRDEGRDGG